MNSAHRAPSMRLEDLDVNLLVMLEALLEERNVTKAGLRVGRSQSAMSHALARLRDLLGDELLVKGKGGMVLTPRASLLAEPLQRGLSELRRALVQGPAFDPATSAREFRLVTSDYMELVLLPRLLARLSKDAPAVSLHCRTVDQTHVPRVLEGGDFDMAVVVRVSDTGESLMRCKLWEDEFVVVARRDHPALAETQELDVQTYVQLGHVLLSPTGRGGGRVDQALEAQGLKRRLALRVGNFNVAPMTVAHSDLLLTAPRRLIEASSVCDRLKVFRPPIHIPRFSVYLTWHEAQHRDPGHRWLRDALLQAAQA